MDLLVAATAHTHRARLYTSNPTDFAGLDEVLDLVALWYAGTARVWVGLARSSRVERVATPSEPNGWRGSPKADVCSLSGVTSG